MCAYLYSNPGGSQVTFFELNAFDPLTQVAKASGPPIAQLVDHGFKLVDLSS